MKLCRVGYVDVILQAYRSGIKVFRTAVLYCYITFETVDGLG